MAVETIHPSYDNHAHKFAYRTCFQQNRAATSINTKDTFSRFSWGFNEEAKTINVNEKRKEKKELKEKKK